MPRLIPPRLAETPGVDAMAQRRGRRAGRDFMRFDFFAYSASRRRAALRLLLPPCAQATGFVHYFATTRLSHQESRGIR